MIADIPTDLQDFVRCAVNSGAYKSESDLMTEALALLRERDQLRQQIAAGLDQLDRGESIPADVVFANLRRRVDSLAGETP